MFKCVIKILLLVAKPNFDGILFIFSASVGLMKRNFHFRADLTMGKKNIVAEEPFLGTGNLRSMDIVHRGKMILCGGFIL